MVADRLIYDKRVTLSISAGEFGSLTFCIHVSDSQQYNSPHKKTLNPEQSTSVVGLQLLVQNQYFIKQFVLYASLG